jgi:hypothetical protein
VEETATYNDVLSPDSWLQLALSIQDTMFTLNDLLITECDLLSGIVSHTGADLAEMANLEENYRVHLDISEILNAEKQIDELTGKLQHLQVSLSLPETLPYNAYQYDYAHAQKTNSDNSGIFNFLLKAGFNGFTDAAFEYEGKNFGRLFLKNFGKNIISQTTDLIVDSGPAIMEESGIASLVGAFGEELMDVGLATSETGVGLIPLAIGTVLTVGSAIYSHFADERPKQKPSISEQPVYISSLQELQDYKIQFYKQMDATFDKISGQPLNPYPNLTNIPLTDGTITRLTAGKYKMDLSNIRAPVITGKERKAIEDRRWQDEEKRIRYPIPQGGRTIIINLNKPMIQNFVINVKEMRESYDSVQKKVEDILLEIVNNVQLMI